MCSEHVQQERNEHDRREPGTNCSRYRTTSGAQCIGHRTDAPTLQLPQSDLPRVLRSETDRNVNFYQGRGSVQPFGHNRNGLKIGGSAPFWWGSWASSPTKKGLIWVPIYHNVAWAEAHLRTSWHLDPSGRLATEDMGRKVGLCRLFWGRGAGSPSSTMWPGPRPTSTPNAILIHPAVWPQQTWAENCGVCRLFGEG